VIRARETQLDRFRAGGERMYANAQMGSREIRKYCELSTGSEHLLERAMVKQGLSARAHDRILEAARTVADLTAADVIEPGHIAEAIQYRTLDRTFWA
jgi:magnesium chelatase family protein